MRQWPASYPAAAALHALVSAALATTVAAVHGVETARDCASVAARAPAPRTHLRRHSAVARLPGALMSQMHPLRLVERRMALGLYRPPPRRLPASQPRQTTGRRLRTATYAVLAAFTRKGKPALALLSSPALTPLNRWVCVSRSSDGDGPIRRTRARCQALPRRRAQHALQPPHGRPRGDVGGRLRLDLDLHHCAPLRGHACPLAPCAPSDPALRRDQPNPGRLPRPPAAF